MKGGFTENDNILRYVNSRFVRAGHITSNVILADEGSDLKFHPN